MSTWRAARLIRPRGRPDAPEVVRERVLQSGGIHALDVAQRGGARRRTERRVVSGIRLHALRHVARERAPVVHLHVDVVPETRSPGRRQHRTRPAALERTGERTRTRRRSEQELAEPPVERLQIDAVSAERTEFRRGERHVRRVEVNIDGAAPDETAEVGEVAFLQCGVTKRGRIRNATFGLGGWVRPEVRRPVVVLVRSLSLRRLEHLRHEAVVGGERVDDRRLGGVCDGEGAAVTLFNRSVGDHPEPPGELYAVRTALRGEGYLAGLTFDIRHPTSRVSTFDLSTFDHARTVHGRRRVEEWHGGAERERERTLLRRRKAHCAHLVGVGRKVFASVVHAVRLVLHRRERVLEVHLAHVVRRVLVPELHEQISGVGQVALLISASGVPLLRVERRLGEL